MKLKIKNTYIYLIISILFVISVDYYFFYFDENILGLESILNFFLLLCVYKLQCLAASIAARTKKFALLYAFLLSSGLSLGRILYDTNRISTLFHPLSNLAFFIVSIVTFTIVLGAAVAIVFSYLENSVHLTGNCPAPSKSNRIKTVLLLWLLIFASWIPTYLAYYPGVFCIDIVTQSNQALGLEPYTRFHPPLHTFIWSLCLKFGKFTGTEAICYYSVLQMLFLSFVFAKMIAFLIKRGVKIWYIVLSLLFVSVNPVISMFSFATTKDIYFAGFFSLALLALFDIISCPHQNLLRYPRKWIPFVIFASFACLFRNNAVHAFFLFLFIIVCILPKYRKGNFVIFLLPILIFSIVNGPIYDHLGILPGNSREKLSVPLQQIADVVTYETYSLSEETKQEINRYLPYDELADLYNPRFADPVKRTFNTEVYNQSPVSFYKLWLKLFIKYPDNYISSFLTLNLPFWYPDACSIDRFSQRYYIATNIKSYDAYTFERQSKFPQLFALYEKAIPSYTVFKKFPLISNVFSIATPVWLLLASLFSVLLRKKKEGIFILAPQLLLWLTYLAGPVSYFRYIFPLFALYPVTFALLLDPQAMLGEPNDFSIEKKETGL